LLLLVLLIAVGLTLALVLPIKEMLLGLAAWFAGAGALGVGVYVALYCLGALMILPASLFVVLAGFSYGLGGGLAVALPAAALAAWLSFWVARTLGRRSVERLIRRRPKLLAIADAARSHGFRWVFLLRLSPVVPFGVLNYVMGVSRISTWDFMLGTALGKSPSVVAYVALGSALATLSNGPTSEASPATRALFWIGLAATLVVVAQITRVVRHRTQALLRESNVHPVE
jgi:uncharacterized membrane protein YdjX (TVP38/TMEM64 family)